LEELYLQRSKEEKKDNTPKSTGAAPDDPILIDVDMSVVSDSSKFTLTVLEAEPSASEWKIAESVTQYTGIPLMADNDTSTSYTRRSSRRRRSRTFSGGLICEDTMQTDICNNVAALRLGLFETLSDSYDLGHRLFLVVTPVDTKAEPDPGTTSSRPDPKIVPLDFSKNQSTILEVAEQALNGDISSLVPKDSLVLVRQSLADESVDGVDHATLMDELIGLSNATAKDPKEKQGRSRTVERGFSGTLLSSGTSTNNSSTGEGKDETNSPDAGSTVTSSKGGDTTCTTALVAWDKNKPVQDRSATSSVQANVSSSSSAAVASPTASDESTTKRRKTSHDTAAGAVVVHDDNDVDMDDAAMPDVIDDTEMPQIIDMTQEENDTTSRLILVVLDELQKQVGAERDSNAIFEASAWAVEQHKFPMEMAQLVEMAITKYYDLTIN
jgi:hypothetical protein